MQATPIRVRRGRSTSQHAVERAEAGMQRSSSKFSDHCRRCEETAEKLCGGMRSPKFAMLFDQVVQNIEPRLWIGNTANQAAMGLGKKVTQRRIVPGFVENCPESWNRREDFGK